MITCNNSACIYNNSGICDMYDEERTDDMRTLEFYEKWNPSMLSPQPKNVERREGDMF